MVNKLNSLYEYASVVWGCCQQGDSDKLEKLQLYAARIVTGLTTIASKDSLYFETGWEPLSCRRQEARLKTMFKLHNNLVPEYLMDILPNMRCNTSIYSTRNSQNYDIPKCRLQTYKSTFIPTVVNEWNSIPLETRNLQSMSKFKSKISNKKSRSAPPSYFDYGNRRLNVLQTRLRHNCVLNNDLFRCNLISSPLCTCGKVEDTYHYFFVCPKYVNARNEFLNKFLQFDKIHILDTHVLLWGVESLSAAENERLFSFVQTFIKHSGRFPC